MEYTIRFDEVEGMWEITFGYEAVYYASYEDALEYLKGKMATEQEYVDSETTTIILANTKVLENLVAYVGYKEEDEDGVRGLNIFIPIGKQSALEIKKELAKSMEG
jgi:carboxypeptidase C (cathepsin A)